MEILNRDANFREDICQRVTSKGNIGDLPKDDIIKISAPFEELKKEGKSISNTDALRKANEQVRQRNLAKMRVLKKEENGGFVLITGVTVLGTLGIGTLIFMAIKSFIAG